jgi:hypothetical protein
MGETTIETPTFDITMPATWVAYFATEEVYTEPDPDYVDEAELCRIYKEAERKPDGSIVLQFPRTPLGLDALSSLVYYTESGIDRCDDSDEAPDYRATCAEMLPLVQQAEKELGEIVDGEA